MFDIKKISRFIALGILVLSPPQLVLSQETNRLNSPIGTIRPEKDLSSTLINFAISSKLNVIADTTSQSYSRQEGETQAKTIGQFLIEQGPLWNFCWNQVDKQSVICWPKSDFSQLAQPIIHEWQKADSEGTQLSPQVREYLVDNARRIHGEGGDAKLDKVLVSSLLLSKIPTSEQSLVLPVVVRAERHKAATFSGSWLTDDFWNRSVVKIKKGTKEPEWWVGGNTVGMRQSWHGLFAPVPNTFLPSSENSLVSESGNAQLGSRWDSPIPSRLLKSIGTLKSVDVSIDEALTRISTASGVTIQLNPGAQVSTKGKKLTSYITDLSASDYLRDIALLFDLRWKIDGDNKVVGGLNDVASQNLAAKIGSLPCLSGWERQLIATHPDWRPQILDESSEARLRANTGIPLAEFSEDLQSSLKEYNQNIESIHTLKTWQSTTNAPASNVRVVWQILPVKKVRNNVALPQERIDVKNPEVISRYFDLRRPFIVAVENDEFNQEFSFPKGILLEKPEGGKGEKVN